MSQQDFFFASSKTLDKRNASARETTVSNGRCLSNEWGM